MLDARCQMLGRPPVLLARESHVCCQKCQQPAPSYLAGTIWPSIEQRKQVVAGDLTLLARTQTNLISQSLTLFVSVQTILYDQGQHFVWKQNHNSEKLQLYIIVSSVQFSHNVLCNWSFLLFVPSKLHSNVSLEKGRPCFHNAGTAGELGFSRTQKRSI